MVGVTHQWNPDDWESFAQGLLQWQHGILDLHRMPASHGGDLGIDYYCTRDSVIYQCYAVEEPIDIATRAERQKNKITTDLNKIVAGAAEVAKLFLGKPLRKWVLLVPLHNSKDVNLHCAKKTAEIRATKLSVFDPEFEVCIHDERQFPGKALQDAISRLSNISLSVDMPTKEELAQWEASSPDLLANAAAKLSKRVEKTEVETAVAQGVEAFLRGNALIDALRSNAPDLHEKISAAIQYRARLLGFAGPKGGPTPGGILHAEYENLTVAIKETAPSLSQLNAQEIALGTISEWIMRCPLRFPNNAS
ncbi:hypothetical protein HEQ75_03400 [Roseomonas sp. BU-1]|uniref:Uncharacterized protein n=1 Tax=Falsiroseomonas selenitidurans TaxID=2716335 RepID=A0ABX1DZU9_9PROT|nr:hypothetical protein [Falsiroseomonas selenitidurans]